ncbi:response regulator transcription factor [Blautia segnis]|uniref:Stage 0 sporulation protein A homolog n=1 Tax=Blautia segnis TaxID=2763030 RepID=A0A8I0AEU6_9FIRM|nr:response regulator transcription factor [Blautia segnis]MBC5651357.1 response regulator transcription factor [Blautia segnis]
MKKILIIEDDLDIQELIQFFLEDQGYEVITASDGIDGIAVFLKEQIDLILLDILLPKMDGYAVCELIRKESEVPIIMISALGREEDQIKGFEMQIDDYIPKPISLPIMIKKIEAVLRRYEGVDITKDHELKYREIILIVGNYQVKIGKKLIDLTQKEYEILKELIENQGCVITRESFLNRLWKYEFEGEERAVDNHIKNLRRKLGKAGDYIKTVRGVGDRIDKAN